MTEANEIEKENQRHQHKADHIAGQMALNALQVPWILLLQFSRGTWLLETLDPFAREGEEAAENKERNDGEESGEHSHPEVSQEFLLKWDIWSGSLGVEVEEQATERELKQKSHVAEHEPSIPPTQRISGGHQIVSLVVGD